MRTLSTLFIALLLTTACGSPQNESNTETTTQDHTEVAEATPAQETPQEVSIQDVGVDAFIAALKENNGLLLDVRSPEEFADGHLAEAVHINVNGEDFMGKIDASFTEKDKAVFIYCGSGVRSMKAANLMKDAGFSNLFNLNGGIQAWKQAGQPVEK